MSTSVIEQLTSDTDRLMQLPVKSVKPSKDNPRRDLGDLEGLAASITSRGIIEPLIVTPNGKGYLLIAGHRRLAAAKLAKLDTVPAIIRAYDDESGARADRLVENLQREDLDALDEAEGFRQLVELGHSQRAIADMVGCTQPHVSKRLALLELPDEIRDGLVAEKVTKEEALELGRLAKKDEVAALQIFKASQQTYYYSEISDDVKDKLDEIRKAENRAQAIAEFEKSSVPLIDLPDVPAWRLADDLPKGTVPLGDERGAIDLDPKKHNGEPCHAIALDRDGGQYPVCTDPARHPGVGTKKAREQAQRAAEEEKRKAEQKAQRAATRARREVASAAVRSFVDSTFDKAELEDQLQLAVAIAVDAVWKDKQKFACQLLEIELEPYKDFNGYSTSYRYADALLAIATIGPAGAAAVIAALNVAAREYHVGDEWQVSHHLDEVRGYFDWLESHGYELTDADRQLLDEAAQAAAERESVDG